MAIERTRLVRHMEQARLLTETERLRDALRSSVSHDLRTSLSAHGYRVLEASCGQEALSRTTTERSDVMMLDLGLPDMARRLVSANECEVKLTPKAYDLLRARSRVPTTDVR